MDKGKKSMDTAVTKTRDFIDKGSAQGFRPKKKGEGFVEKGREKVKKTAKDVSSRLDKLVKEGKQAT
ncbi:MAG: hypothetical protein U5N58_15230 [Actinomycetota bacterium]|nr:hypothetical protein [Actinomycetota bacterium]